MGELSDVGDGSEPHGARKPVRATMLARLKDRAWRVRDDVRRNMYLREVTRANRNFDQRFGTNTAAPKAFEDYAGNQQTPLTSTRYEAVNESGFRTIIDCTIPDPEDYTFVDIGSGKGKALLLAGTYPFQKVTGVEFDEPLHSIAEKNIEIGTARLPGRCSDIRSLNMNALLFDDYSEKTFVFVFNPFQGKIMEDFVERLREEIAGKNREAVVVYLNPVAPEWFDNADFLHEHARTNRIAVYATSGVSFDPNRLQDLKVKFSTWG